MQDSYNTFYFYKWYADYVSIIPKEYRHEFLLAIITYGTEKTYLLTDPAIEACFQQCKASIDASVERYQQSIFNGMHGGRPREINRDEVVRLHTREDLKVKDLAKVFNCSERTIHRILKWHRDNPLGETLFSANKKKNYRSQNYKLKNKLVYGDEDYSPLGLCLSDERIEELFPGKYNTKKSANR